MGETAVNLLGASVVLKVLVVSENIDDELSAKEEVAPMFKGMDNCKEFAVPDGVISFSFGERGGIVPNRMTEAAGITLVEDGTCCILRSVYLYFEGLIVVGLAENQVSGCEGDQSVEGGSAGGRPYKGYAFLEEVQKGSGNFGESWDEGAVVAQDA